MKGHIFQNLNKNAAQTKHQHRSELRIAVHSQYYFQPPGYHLFDIDAVDLGFRRPFTDFQHHQVVGILDGFAIGKIELNSAHITLANDVRRGDFQSHRIADAFSNFNSFFLVNRQTSGGYFESVGAEDIFALDFPYRLSAGTQSPGDDSFHPSPVDPEMGNLARRPVFP